MKNQLKSFQGGLSLIELLISIAIGAMLLAALVSAFKTSSDSYRELQKSADLIENGRYAAELLHDDIRHAGFYGHFAASGTFPGTLPDPCELADENALLNALIVPIQAYDFAAGINASSCDDKGFFTAADLKPNSDILVIRHADTALFAGTDQFGANPVSATSVDGEVYIQSNTRDVEIKIANGTYTINPSTSNADVKGGTTSLVKYPGKSALPYADVRKYSVHIYYVSRCNAAAVCTSSDTPTLKRLELDDNGSGGTTFNVIPLVEGVEHFHVEFGIDNTPATVNAMTGHIGDSVPDSYVAIPATVAEFENIVSVKAHLLVRSLDSTTGYNDNKVYVVGTTGNGAGNGSNSLGPFNDAFKRNVYRFEVRPTNIASKREIP